VDGNSTRTTQNHAVTSLTRSGGNDIFHFEGVDCAELTPNFDQTCENVNISTSFDSAGWAKCTNGSWLHGLYRSSAGNGIDVIDGMQCCGATNPADREWHDCNIEDIGLSFDNAGTVSCPKGKVVVGIERSGSLSSGGGNGLQQIEKMECCSVEEVNMTSTTTALPPAPFHGIDGPLDGKGDWSSSFDSAGWSYCESTLDDTNGDQHPAATSLIRSDGNDIVDLEGVDCASVLPAYPQMCSEVDISSTFNGDSWVECPAGMWLNGLYRGGNNIDIDDVDTMNCCGHRTLEDRGWHDCVEADISIAFDSAGNHGCEEGKVIVGINRSNGAGGKLFHVEKLKCCTLEKITADEPVRLGSPPPMSPPPPSAQ